MSLNWQDQKKLAELAELKLEINTLEKRAKEIQEALLAKYEYDQLPKDWTFSEGKLVLCSRQNWDKVDNKKVLLHITQEMFNKYTTITASALEKAGGEVLVEKLLAAKVLSKKPATIYYSLKVDKGV